MTEATRSVSGRGAFLLERRARPQWHPQGTAKHPALPGLQRGCPQHPDGVPPPSRFLLRLSLPCQVPIPKTDTSEHPRSGGWRGGMELRFPGTVPGLGGHPSPLTHPDAPCSSPFSPTHLSPNLA